MASSAFKKIPFQALSVPQEIPHKKTTLLAMAEKQAKEEYEELYQAQVLAYREYADGCTADDLGNAKDIEKDIQEPVDIMDDTISADDSIEEDWGA